MGVFVFRHQGLKTFSKVKQSCSETPPPPFVPKRPPPKKKIGWGGVNLQIYTSKSDFFSFFDHFGLFVNIVGSAEVNSHFGLLGLGVAPRFLQKVRAQAPKF